MDTTTFNHVEPVELSGFWLFVDDCTPGLFLVLVVWILYRVIRRIFRSRAERAAKNLINAYDNEVKLSLSELVEKERVDAGVAAEEPAGGRRVRFRPRSSRNLACALSWEAYSEFGYRPKSEANVMITRKYMRDLLREYKDLRACDMSDIIDTAVGLSFLPSQSLRAMNDVVGSKGFSARADDKSPTRRWWWPFGGRHYAA